MLKLLSPALHLVVHTIACLLMAFGMAEASKPEEIAKKALGGTIERVHRMETPQGDFLLVLHRPHKEDSQVLTLLRSFAGHYVTVFETEDILIEDSSPVFDLFDSDRNGVPEVYWVSTQAASVFLIEWHRLYEPVSKRTFIAKVTFSGSYPGVLSVDDALLDPRMVEFRKALEGKVSQSTYLKDPRTLEQRARDQWVEEWYVRHGMLGTRAGDVSSLVLTKLEASLKDPRCLVGKSFVRGHVMLAGRDYLSLDGYGVIEVDRKSGSCSLILGSGTFGMLELKAAGSILTMEQNQMGILTTYQYNPTSHALSIKQEFKPLN